MSHLGEEELPSTKAQHSTLRSPGPGSGAFWDDVSPSRSAVLPFRLAGLLLSLVAVQQMLEQESHTGYNSPAVYNYGAVSAFISQVFLDVSV